MRDQEHAQRNSLNISMLLLTTCHLYFSHITLGCFLPIWKQRSMYKVNEEICNSLGNLWLTLHTVYIGNHYHKDMLLWMFRVRESILVRRTELRLEVRRQPTRQCKPVIKALWRQTGDYKLGTENKDKIAI